ncbi:MAG: hypothetical protein NVSMB1_07630 [Polyangiales bacterium]
MIKVVKAAAILHSLTRLTRGQPTSLKSIKPIEVATVRCRERARQWVHAYAAGGAAFAFVPIPVPGSTTAGLIALETTMVHAIGRIYGIDITARDAAAMVAGLEVAGGALKTVAREATLFLPVIGWIIRGTIAAAGIEAIGNAVIALFERRHPGRYCASAPRVTTLSVV